MPRGQNRLLEGISMGYMTPWLQGRPCQTCGATLWLAGRLWQCACPDVQVSDLNLMVGMETLPDAWHGTRERRKT
jgi:hypothetical protein